jgi:flagellar hook-basal body complex protein FliE
MDRVAPIASAPLFSSPEPSRALEDVSRVGGGPLAQEHPTSIDSFGSMLGSALEDANRADLAAIQKVEALASGAADDLHGTMISVKEAEIGIRLVGTVRNKILDAFQELWRTNV